MAIKTDIPRAELDRFARLAERQLALDPSDPLSDAPYDEEFVDGDVHRVVTVGRSELLDVLPSIDLEVAIALSRLRKEIPSAPNRTEAGFYSLEEVYRRMLRDIVRPLRGLYGKAALLLNADVAAAHLDVGQDFPLERAIIALFDVDHVQRMAEQILLDLDGPGVEALVEERASSPYASREARVGLVCQTLVDRLVAEPNHDDRGVLRKMVARHLIDTARLPERHREQIQIDRWTRQFAENPNALLQLLQQAKSSPNYPRMLAAMVRVAYQLAAMAHYEHVLLIIEEINDQLARTSPLLARADALRKAIEALGNPERMHPIAEGVLATRAEDRRMCRRVLSALGERGVPMLIDALFRAPDGLTRDEILRTLEELGDHAVEPLLREVESVHHRPSFLAAIIELMGRMERYEAREAIQFHLKHTHPGVRKAAVRAFHALAGHESESLLMARFDFEANDGVLAEILERLGDLGTVHSRLRQFLGAAITSETFTARDPELCAATLNTIERLGDFPLPEEPDRHVEDVLLAFVEPPNSRISAILRRREDLSPELRAHILGVLGKIGSERSLAALAAMTHSEQETHRATAQEAYQILSHRLEAFT